VQGDGRAGAGQTVHGGRVLDLLEHVARRAVLGEYPEARTGVAEAPRRELDRQGVERGMDLRVVQSHG
jgi:hypothetical protein